MAPIFKSILIALAAAAISVSASPVRRTIPYNGPDQSYTTGQLCSPSDPWYQGEAYGISKCTRHVTRAEKDEVAAHYGTDPSEYSSVEFDHLIPLGIGGSNDASNLWPQPGPSGQSDSGSKDAVENQAYQQLSSGQISQREAVQMICDWLNQNYGTSYSADQYGL
ncbi:hypothetical protein HDU76_003169 [Blyttiomyces sp. JEL0837]|nr:hypothetical protein HDU76_003169 [Blyttiomyces sp. JEL0837]